MDSFEINETFIGYHQDTTASYVKTGWKKLHKSKEDENKPLHDVPPFYRERLIDECKLRLLRTASYDGLVRFSLSKNETYNVSNMSGVD